MFAGRKLGVMVQGATDQTNDGPHIPLLRRGELAVWAVYARGRVPDAERPADRARQSALAGLQPAPPRIPPLVETSEAILTAERERETLIEDTASGRAKMAGMERALATSQAENQALRVQYQVA